MKETIDFVRAVGALEGFPIHDELLSERGRTGAFNRLNEMTATRIVNLRGGARTNSEVSQSAAAPFAGAAALCVRRRDDVTAERRLQLRPRPGLLRFGGPPPWRDR